MYVEKDLIVVEERIDPYREGKKIYYAVNPDTSDNMLNTSNARLLGTVLVEIGDSDD